MRSTARPLRVVDPARDPGAAPPRRGPAAAGDVGLVAFLFAVCLVPLVALAAGGAWGDGVTGLATAGALFSGGALVQELRLRARRP